MGSLTSYEEPWVWVDVGLAHPYGIGLGDHVLDLSEVRSKSRI